MIGTTRSISLVMTVLLTCPMEIQGYSSGTILVRISSFLNPDGRDAAGACCQRAGKSLQDNDLKQDVETGTQPSRGGRGRGSSCSAPCYTMFRVCADRILHEGVVVVAHDSSSDKLYEVPIQDIKHQEDTQDTGLEDTLQQAVQQTNRIPLPAQNQKMQSDFDRENILSRNPQKPRLPTRFQPNVASAQPPPNPPTALRPPYQAAPRPPPNFNRPDYPLKARPRPLSRPPRPLSAPESRGGYPPFGERFWKYSKTKLTREDRALFDTGGCAYGSLQTNVLFNNSLQGGGDLLVRIPFRETWDGIFSLSIEAWHVNNPKTIPQPQKAAREKEKEKNIFERLFSILGSSIQTNLKELVDEKLPFNQTDIEKEADEGLTEDDDIVETSIENDDSKQAGQNSTTAEKTLNNDTVSSLVSITEITVTNTEDGEDVSTEPGPVKEEEEADDEDEEDEEEEEDEGSGDVEPDDQPDDDEEIDPVEGLLQDGALILRAEKTHVLYAGEPWKNSFHVAYNARIDYSIKMVCAHNFTGETCSFAKICLNKKMKNHRRMYCTAAGEVVCRDGWKGNLCEEPVCRPGCHQAHGFCEVPGDCKCKSGYSGPTCQECVRLPGCQHGYCTKGYECKCVEGFSGLFCNKPICREGCSSTNGYCKEPGTCVCRTGWTGSNCTECVPLKGCVHGTCTQPFQCNCDEQYTGKYCSEPRCSPDCSSVHGYCNNPGECICRVGWQGQTCDECVKYPGCLNGDCKDPWECRCRQGWKGENCTDIETEDFKEDVRDGRCNTNQFRCMNRGEDWCQYNNNGTLVGEPVCRCTAQYQGKYCQSSVNTELNQN